MLDEPSPVTAGSREWRRRVRLDFLMAELQTGHVSASLAMTSNDAARAAWYRYLGWEAHDAVVRFRPTLVLSHDEDDQISSELESLELKLENLEQPEVTRVNSDGAGVFEVRTANVWPAFRRLRATR